MGLCVQPNTSGVCLFFFSWSLSVCGLWVVFERLPLIPKGAFLQVSYLLASLLQECDLKENMSLWTVLENLSSSPHSTFCNFRNKSYFWLFSVLLSDFYYENAMEAYADNCFDWCYLSEREELSWTWDGMILPGCISDVLKEKKKIVKKACTGSKKHSPLMIHNLNFYGFFTCSFHSFNGCFWPSE